MKTLLTVSTLVFANKSLFASALLAVCALLSACSTGKIHVESEPKEAMVKLVDSTTGKQAILGTTPLDISGNTTQLFEADLLHIEVIKDGYHTERFWLPNAVKFDDLSNLKMEVHLKPKPAEESNVKAQDTWNTALKKYVQSQRFVTKRKYRLAEAKLYEAIELVGEFPEAKRLMGTIQYLEGHYDNSERTWRELLVANPNDLEALGMIKRIRKEMGEKPEQE